MTFNWWVITRYYPLLIRGLMNTAVYAGISMLLAFILGLLVSVVCDLKLSGLNKVAGAYISWFRETPLLVQIYFIFFVFPAFGLRLTVAQTGILAIVLNEGAFIAEIIRGGIEGIPVGEKKAGASLGMSRLQIMRFIVLPQAIRNVLPALLGQFSIIIKDTSLLSIISVEELGYAAADIAARTFDTLTPYISAEALYLFLFGVLSLVTNVVTKRIRTEKGV